MSKPKSGPQDLPPMGGYPDFQIARVKLRTVIGGRLGVGLFIASNLIGFPLYYYNWVKCRKDKIEHMSTQIATFPLLYAERDRAMLKQMKRMRVIEADLMKDFPFWEAGTFFGTPIFETLPTDKYIDPVPVECYVGTGPTDFIYLATIQSLL